VGRRPISVADNTSTTRFVAVLELDADPSSPAANIIGGEFLNDASSGADRLSVPPFVWISNGPGSGNLSTSVNGNNHNPYLKPSLVQQLVALGTEQTADADAGVANANASAP
jgi:hypothetical protein